MYKRQGVTPLEGVTPTPFLPARPRFSAILCKFAHIFVPTGVTPWMVSPGRSAPSSLVTPLLCEETRSSAGLLIEFDEHATGLHVFDVTDRLPNTNIISVDGICTAPIVPPSAVVFNVCSAVNTNEEIVVFVCGTELHSVGIPVRPVRIHKSIAGISAVPVHRQLILINLITDGERRVLSPVPLTVSTTDLHRHSYNTSNMLATR